MGQSIVTIGTGTGVNAFMPTQTNQTYSYTQQIYRASEINGTGTIKSIAFYGTANGCTRSLDIYLINTTKETFSSTSDWISVSDYDKVYSGSVTFSNNSWTTVTISDFTYTGNSLALIVHDKTNNTESKAVTFRYNYTYSNSALYKLGDDASSPITAPTNGTRTSNRNNIQLSIAYDYPEPTELIVSDITNESASIAWTDCTATTGNTFSRYEYQLKTSGLYGSLTTTSNPCELSELEAGTNYTIRVRAVYTDGASTEHTSKWVDTSFTTDCDDLDVSLASWDFEGTSTLPDCWRIKESSGDYPKINTSSSYSHGGNNSLQFCNTGNQVVLLPAIDGGLNGNTLSFYAKRSGTGTYTITVGYYNSLGVFTTIKNDFSLSDTYQSFEVEFTELPNYVKKVAIKGYTDASHRNLYIDDVSIVAPESCAPVTSPTVGTVTYNSAQLSWTAGGSESNWKLQYKDEDDADWTTIGANSNPYTLTGLTENTTYMWKVAAWCDTSDDENISTYVTGEDFTTPAQYPMPTGLEAYNITANSADITWTAGSIATAWQLYYTPYDYATPGSASPGDYINISTTPAYSMTGLTGNTTYYVYVRADYGSGYSSWTDAMSFRTSVSLPYSYDFTDASELNAWTLYDCVSSSGINETGSNYYFSFVAGSPNPQHLITPAFENNSNTLLVSFDYKIFSGTSPYPIINVGYSTTDNDINSFTWPSSATISVNATSYQNFEYIFQTKGIKYIAIKYDKNGVYLRADIDNISFTPIDKVYTGGSDEWNYLADWTPAGLPESTDDVYINSAITIPNACTAVANNITLGPSGSLTIADGGQLVCNNAVQATVQKSITGYGEGNDKWYFIASPINVDNLAPTNVSNMLSNYYDLYQLDNTTWENYKEHDGNAHPLFKLANGRGYLYANSANVNLAFAGTTKPYDAEHTISVSEGWNLVGNPYTFEAYVNTPYYAMNEGGTGITATTVSTSTAVKPCTGIIVKADEAGTVKFLNEAPASSTNNGDLQIALAHKVVSRDGASVNKTIDNAIVSFNEGGQLEKFHFGNPAASIFIPQNGEDYAIAFSDRKGEVPVNFKANETGTYTISFAGDEMNLNGIYLIDILAEEEIDLSVNPSYTFIGSPADRAERFVIRFENSEQSENSVFAYQSGSDIVVTGEGELQIFDVMGRMVSRQYVSGVETINAMPYGVYIFKLNGMTQKIVVR